MHSRASALLLLSRCSVRATPSVLPAFRGLCPGRRFQNPALSRAVTIAIPDFSLEHAKNPLRTSAYSEVSVRVNRTSKTEKGAAPDIYEALFKNKTQTLLDR